ncbi:MAG: hypothetical protein EAZ98_10625 [Oscillatoriales cyanobacterium]|jgi:hypothetical protein|uniref:Uncharacterized protein n=1 Tax=Microcoleus anatoxicus PTRS2 TaxID=2705321 RepID=A0ABU8YGF2_9CYAN|nr:MAG: hypothetical protein EA000_16365 [Oscillatoriales cyanobacterium]TAD97104.1 MAG: hypothetical protein EAZ98_10625 [Oscillatoriales cyanobacterium]TAE04633.1 MAG: hypothetical protein EAZ96_08465 [Oscillatoriales cyanobacterium]TAF36990.1 MAG: hypothetical protein EAZ68_15605 [Oscillatoriales cyanobacterium]TAF62215.1 MAG: hypothetical protein EAZ59_24250 [Oscillatoriales cyanobacterium]
MNPEIMINSFLEVLKTSPNLFSEPATAALKTLEEIIVAADNKSNQAISDILSDWCCNYREITEAVKAAATRGKAIPKASQPQRDENISENQFPRRFPLLIQSLEKRISDTPKN